jgi:hypothetical protein
LLRFGNAASGAVDVGVGEAVVAVDVGVGLGDVGVPLGVGLAEGVGVELGWL